MTAAAVMMMMIALFVGRLLGVNGTHSLNSSVSVTAKAAAAAAAKSSAHSFALVPVFAVVFCRVSPEER